MSEQERFDPWHILIVEDDGGDELDYTLEHPDSCPEPAPDANPDPGAPPGWYTGYRCFTADQLGEGPDEQLPTEPGRYRARGHAWCSGYYEPEWDSELEWQPLGETESKETKND